MTNKKTEKPKVADIRPGVLLSVKRGQNVWDVPCHVSPSMVLESLERMEPVLVIEVPVMRKNYTNSPLLELKVLTCRGHIGWLTLDKDQLDWVIHQ